jgi:aminoglycoside 6'-N-acetyltransferase I
MDTPLHIEKIGSESIDPAFDLLGRFFLEEGFDTPAEQMRTFLAAMLVSQDSAIFLARYAGEILGIATVTTSLGLEYGRSAELEDLYVLPKARNRGIASALIETVYDWCRQQGCSIVLVTVTPQGEAAHELMGFYQQRGFVNTQRFLMECSLLTEYA